jgi:hypothetical protein
MARGVCQLCDEEGELLASHVLPEFFYESAYDESGRFASVSNHPRHRPRALLQKGLTEYLLCAACERRFSRYESYSATLLRRIDAAMNGVPDGAPIADVDFTTFRLFGLSLLWRSHIARGHMFGQVDLGPLAERLRAMLQADHPGAPHEYGFAIAKVVGLGTRGDMILGPVKSKYRGRRAYHLMARGYDWAFVVSRDSATLTEHFPFVGTDPTTLWVPTIHHDRGTLFAQLRHAFPKALGKKR